MNEKKKMNIAVDASYFLWGGGIDFITTLIEGMSSAENVDLKVFLRKDSKVLSVLRLIRLWINCHFDIKVTRKKQLEHFHRYDGIKSFVISNKNLEIVYYSYYLFRSERGLNKMLNKYRIDVLLPVNRIYKALDVNAIGYIYDFQHKYLPELFAEDDIRERDDFFGQMLETYKAVIVNSKSVKNDIYKYFPDSRCHIIALPFYPFQIPKIAPLENVKKYNLPKEYFIISNQFWKHKNHKVAFDALEILYNEGYTNWHIVCTGKMEDARDVTYIPKLMEYIDTLHCKDNILLLGFIPKDDQMRIMLGAEALIQPTLFEGGPGGGATYNAIALGLPCILSDIEINKEITNYEKICYFKANSPEDLARVIKETGYNGVDLEYDRLGNAEKNKSLYGDTIANQIRNII